MADPDGTIANPSQVELTSPRSALNQKIMAGIIITFVLAGCVIAIVMSDAWWQVVLWSAVALFMLIIGFGLGVNAGDAARATVALQAVGVTVRAEVLAAQVVRGVEDLSYDLTLWITLPDGTGFQVEHRCGEYTCIAAARQPGSMVAVLVDPTVRTWGVIH